jgi:hypothetical protein
MKTNHTTNASLRKVLGLVPVAADRGWLSVDEGDDTAGGGGAGGEEGLGDAGKAALQTERQARKELDRQLKEALAKLKVVEGIDPTVFREATQKAQELELRNAELQSAADRARQEAEQTYSVQLQQASQRIRDVETRLQEQEMEYIGERLFLAAKGRPVVSESGTSNFTMFWREARGHFARDEQGLYVVDRRAGDGKTPLIDSESGKRVDPSKYVAEVLAEDAVLTHLFEPKYGTGSGGQGGSAGRTITGVDLDGMSSTQLIGLGLKS